MGPARIAFVRGDDPRPDAAGAVEVLALGDVELAVVQPVANTAFVAQRHAEDVVPCPRARDVPALLADNDHQLPLIVELFRYLRLLDSLVEPTTEEGLRTN